jgi:hypothetical protein
LNKAGILPGLFFGRTLADLLNGRIEFGKRVSRATPRYRVETLPGLNHLFMAGHGEPTPAEYFAAGHVDSSAIGRIAHLIETVTGADREGVSK